MGIRSKSFLAVLVPLLLVAAVLAVVAGHIMIKSALEQEQKTFLDQLSRVQNILALQVEELTRVASDYATWDDTYAFVENKDPAYAEANFTTDTFLKNGLEMAVFLSATGEPLFSLALDPDSESFTNVPSSLMAILQQSNMVSRRSEVESTASGFLSLPDGVVMAASAPIVTSQGEGPVRGALVFARRVNESLDSKITRVLGSELDFFPVAGGDLPADVAGELASPRLVQSSMDWRVIRRDRALGYLLIHDVFGAPIMMVRVPLSRDHYVAAWRSLVLVVGMMLFLLFVASLVVIGIMDRMVLRKLSIIDDGVREIYDTGQLSLRIPLAGTDHMARLAGRVNRLMDKLNHEQLARAEGDRLLRDAKQRVEMYLDVAEVIIVALDLNGNILLLNRRGCELLGYPVEYALGKNWFDLVIPDGERQETKELFGRLMQGTISGPYINENPVRTAWGDSRRVAWRNTVLRDATGHIVGTLSSGEDVTEKRDVQRRLEVVARQWEQSFHAIRDALAVLDANGTILRSNRAFGALLGLDEKDLFGRHCADLFLGEIHSAECPLTAARQSGKRESMVLHHESKVLEITVDPIMENGVFSGAVYVVGDVTEREQMTQTLRDEHTRLAHALTDLQKAQNQIVQQERMQALVRMASGIAHDINNLLMPVVGVTDLLLSSPDILQDHDETVKLLKDIHVAGMDARQVVRQLRELYRPSVAGEFVPLDIRKVVDSAISLAKPKWAGEAQARGVNISVQVTGTDLPVVLGNETELREVFMNLIFNSVDAMPDGGDIRIALTYDRKMISVRVADSGIGIPDQIKHHMFEPFYSTKGSHGSGLGLTVVHSIITRHGGTVAIESRANSGTTVSFTLPIGAGTVAPPPFQPVEGATKALKVLLVDDEETIRRMIARFLVRLGHQPVSVSSPEEGLAQVQKAPFDVVITDMAMPAMNGVQLGLAIKKIFPAMPVILLTGFGDLMNADQVKPDGVDIILGKPTTMAEIRRAFATLIVS